MFHARNFLAIAAPALLVASSAAAQTRVTFTRDVAPILLERCATCHRPGEIGPFSLLTYEEARPRAAAIARAMRDRTMPPWKPEPGYGDFTGSRRLSDHEIDVIQEWVRAGSPRGDAADQPTAPSFPTGWRLGTPDLVVTMPEAYMLPGGGRDELRNFVVPIPLSRARYVRGIEFRPGNNRVVHHANLRIDRSGTSRRLDRGDGKPGFDGLITTGSFPEGHFLGWTPGQLPPLAAGDLAWRLETGSDLVLQLHMQPSAQPERVQAAVGFFFTDQPPERTPLMLRLGRQNIDIAPGTSRYVEEDSYVLPIDVEVRAVQPHAHFRAREVRGFATLPDGTRKWLLFIKDWDFYWQDVYRFATPFVLPKGTTLAVQFVFDNSTANRRNPERPPARVRWGQNSTDEMGDLWIQVVPQTPADREHLRADFGPKVLAEDAIGYEKMLETDPRNPRLHNAVAAIDLALGRIGPAAAHLEESLRLDPESAEAHYNLGTALARQGRTAESLAHLRRALQIDPRHVAAHVNLGVALRSERQFEEAAAEFRRALAIDPANAAAHTNLGGTLAAQRRLREAIAEYRAALQTNPDLLEALTDLSWILATSPLREAAEAVRLAERATSLTEGRDVRALETAAAAYAANGQFELAVMAQQRAIDLAEAAGNRSGLEVLRARLDLYRRGVAYSEP